MSQSLKTFYDESTKADLNTCDLEQLHLSGAVQSTCALLAISLETGSITAFSENLPELLELPTEKLVETEYDSLSTAFYYRFSQLKELVIPKTHLLLDFRLTSHAGFFDQVIHVHEQTLFIELLPAGTLSNTQFRNYFQKVKSAYKKILNAESYHEALQITVNEVRALSGFHRVQIYELADDWSGEIIAESRTEDMPSYLNNHFPSMDIPKQARYLFQMIPYRIVTDTEDKISKIFQVSKAGQETKPLDLTWSLARSVSPVHTQYLRNMNIGASLVLGIEYKGKLKQMLVLHHNQPACPAFDIWGMIRDIGDALALRYQAEQDAIYYQGLNKVRSVEARIANMLEKSEDLGKALKISTEDIRSLISAQGFAFITGGKIYTSGMVPPDEFILELVDWVTTDANKGLNYVTQSLHQEFEPARNYIDEACGVIFQPVKTHTQYYMIWFRGPVTKQIQWAGKYPTEKEVASAKNTPLTPRHSFETWEEEHRNECKDWTATEIRVASEAIIGIIDSLASQARELANAKQQVEKISQIDYLTNVMTRRHFFTEAEKVFAQAQSGDKNFSIALIDVDNFKDINQRYGHLAGDKILNIIAQNIAKQASDMNDGFVGRYAGEMFIMCLPDINISNAYVISERIRSEISELQILFETHNLMLTVSIGLTEYYTYDESIMHSIKRADEALAKAKQDGKNQVREF